MRRAVVRTHLLFLSGLAFVWRPLLFRTTVIAVTGSVGKTTAKECLAAILAEQAPTVKTYRNSNGRRGIPQTILRVQPWKHRYVVIEIGTDGPGNMIRSSFLVRPDVALILAVAPTHTTEFRSLEETAKEKAKLMRFLRRGGTVVLNGDDPRVAAMTPPLRSRIVRFGTSPEHDVWANEASSVWPARLEFRVSAGGESHVVKTQSVGTHWLPSVLGALAVARSLGVSLASAAEAVKGVPPFPGRMQPAALPSGAIVVRDEYNGAIHSANVACEFLRNARANRKVLVLSDCSDFGKNYRHRHRYLGRLAAECCESAVFVGGKTGILVKQAIQSGLAPENVHSCASLEEAAEFLKSELRAGDLVLLKGRVTDHLTRLYYAQLGAVACWKSHCVLRRVCDFCPELGAQTANTHTIS